MSTQTPSDPPPLSPPPARLRLRLLFGGGLMLGPGKADLLQAIRDTGSIAAAGRRMGMSYRRAWALVEEMNAAFAAPVVDSARGGPGGGGAQLSPTGEDVLRLYRAAEDQAAHATAGPVSDLAALLSPGPATKAAAGAAAGAGK